MTEDDVLEDALNRVWRPPPGTASVRPRSSAKNDTQQLSAALRRLGPDGAAAVIQRWLAALALRTSHVSVVATGLEWVGGGTRSVEQTLLSLIGKATREILVTAYSLTGGSGRVTEQLARAAATGIRCVFVINRLTDQPTDIRVWLEDLACRYPAAVAVYDFENQTTEGLHAKVVVVDRAAAVVGSANLTFHGMTLSHELGLLVQGPAAVAVASAVDQLTSSARVRRAY